MNVNDFTPGDVLLFTQRSKRGTEYRTGLVTHTNGPWVCYIGHHVDGYLESGSGAFDPTLVGTRPYGFHCAVEKIGRAATPMQGFWRPRPGDTGYDLMC
jgi:hypothetical protein